MKKLLLVSATLTLSISAVQVRYGAPNATATKSLEKAVKQAKTPPIMSPTEIRQQKLEKLSKEQLIHRLNSLKQQVKELETELEAVRKALKSKK